MRLSTTMPQTSLLRHRTQVLLAAPPQVASPAAPAIIPVPEQESAHARRSARDHRSGRHPRLLRRRWRHARPSAGLSRDGRREVRRMRLLRPPFRAARRSAGALTANAPAAPIKRGDHLYLVDGSGYLFRAYHALPPLSRKSDGLPTGAVSGFSNMLWKLLEDMRAGDKPTHLAVIFDAGKTTFRNGIYPAYKANRPDP